MKIMNISATLFIIFSSNLAMANEVLTGDTLVKSLSGKSFSCMADGAPMSIAFSVATKNGHVSYSGIWKGKSFKSKYKLTRKGTYTQGGRSRTFSSSSNGQLIISGSGVPDAFCTLQ
ncbi:hypothetical protein [Pseudophaeobacter arcticus]|jgi:hypothetical protein|uniref:hypothetical protein n=1 Tax=Pseudophaeobacter arcticus TaxID=385492 RepID=UPI0033408724